MSAYAFLIYKDPRSVPSVEVEEFQVRDSAIAYARRLLLRDMRYSAVQVIEGASDIGRIERKSERAA